MTDASHMVSYEFVLQRTRIALSCYRDAKAREASALMETHWRGNNVIRGTQRERYSKNTPFVSRQA
jgi:hypothetical protein